MEKQHDIVKLARDLEAKYDQVQAANVKGRAY
jgi:hypothetical protein